MNLWGNAAKTLHRRRSTFESKQAYNASPEENCLPVIPANLRTADSEEVVRLCEVVTRAVLSQASCTSMNIPEQIVSFMCFTKYVRTRLSYKKNFPSWYLPTFFIKIISLVE
ncbi:hypothetical protein CEXT_687891 [Caerostris extrusa]|uniref:Uncharacterized protein n=1 Tax=Caerostris extrusa TaxID=172846 RepID=A0AAV4QUU7_CAEEX|nr:hypothetical protein CEXT_687891 [Caerostris extrusa]